MVFTVLLSECERSSDTDNIINQRYLTDLALASKRWTMRTPLLFLPLNVPRLSSVKTLV